MLIPLNLESEFVEPKVKNYSPRKTEILATSEQNAAGRKEFWRRAEFFHEEDLRYLRIPDSGRLAGP